MLEEKYGREKFDRFLKAYFNEFQFQSMDSYKFENFLNEKLLHSDPKMQSVVKEWIYEPGLPQFKPSYSNSKFLKVEEWFGEILVGCLFFLILIGGKKLKIIRSSSEFEGSFLGFFVKKLKKEGIGFIIFWDIFFLDDLNTFFMYFS